MYRPTLRQQRLMVPLLDNPATLEHEDLVGPLHRRQAMGHDEDRPSLEKSLDRILNQPLRLGIQRARRLVEDEDRGVTQDRPCDRDSLTLPPGELGAPLADDRVVPVSIRSTNSCAFAARAAASTCSSEASGRPYAMLARTVSWNSTVSWETMPMSDLNSVTRSPSRSRPSMDTDPSVTSKKRLRRSTTVALARADRPHQRHHDSSGHGKGNVLEHRFTASICERHVVEAIAPIESVERSASGRP